MKGRSITVGATITVATLVMTIGTAPLVVAEQSASYTVRAGDSLWLIAEQHDVSIRELTGANGLTITSTIHPGQSLTIPGQSTGLGPATTNGGRVTVRSGDSLWSIAQRARVGLGALVSASGLSMDSVIHPGQSIALPGGAEPPAATTDAEAPSGGPPRPNGESSYTVRPGDSLTVIARRLGVSVSALLEANALALSTVIHPGQRLTVPETTVPRQVSTSDHLIPIFEKAAHDADIPADLLMAVAYVESRWQQSARSSAGAVGVGQLMPRTAAWVARDLMGEPGLDISDTTDNIRMSAHLLAWLLDEAGGDADRALAMYLQGVYGVRANGISNAAVAYAEKVSSIRRQFR